MRSIILGLVASIVVATAQPSFADTLDDLAAAAKQEGELTLIGLPDYWCGYGHAIEAFAEKYGLKVNSIFPSANAGEEIEALRANRDNSGPQAPDVIEVGFPYGILAKEEGLTQSYRLLGRDAIPDWAKDEEGYWYADSVGVLAFEINTDIVKTIPADWGDLLDPKYARAVGLSSDPRTSNQGMQAIYAAGLSVTDGDASTAAEKGLAFFADLIARGNFVSARGTPAAIAHGTTPIVIRWDFLALTDRDTFAGNPPVEVVVPQTGVVGGVQVHAISATAPHPNAAKLWVEYLNSDEAQLNYLANYCHPVRFAQLLKENKIPADILTRVPPAEAYDQAVRPTPEELDRARDEIVGAWGEIVAKAE